MTGRLGGKQAMHDIEAEWVLKREYMRLHEVSREKDASGAPAYEAIVFISWDAKANEYRCLWLDNTAGGGLSAEIARGRQKDGSVELVFAISPWESLHTTLRYAARTDTWEMTIDDLTEGKTDRFGDVRLTRAGSDTR